MKQELLKKIEEKKIVAGVVGLGYVGLPLAVEKAKAGFKTIGFDVQKAKVDLVNAGKNSGGTMKYSLSGLSRTLILLLSAFRLRSTSIRSLTSATFVILRPQLQST